MKASVKLREEEGKPPLLRAKVPISIFSLPFSASFSAGEPTDLSLHLITSFSTYLPSIKLSYHPNPNPNPNPNSISNPKFSLSVRSSLTFPIRFSVHLSAPSASNPTFSLRFAPQLGDFSFTKKSISNPNPNPNPIPKENGGAIYRPIPVSLPEPLHRTWLEEMIAAPMAMRVGTAVPLGPRTGVRVRWKVGLPVGPAGINWRGRLPYLTVDKISIERVKKPEEDEETTEKEWTDKDAAAMAGMCFWMGREVEELRKESVLIKHSIESLENTFSQNRKGVENAARKKGVN